MDLGEAGEGETDRAWSADVVVHGMIASVGGRSCGTIVKVNRYRQRHSS
jgi:hypothetical protein